MKKRVLFLSHIGFVPPDAGHRARIGALVNATLKLGHEVWFHGLGLPDADVRSVTELLGNRASFSLSRRARDMRPWLRGAWTGLRNRWYHNTGLPRPVDFWFQEEWSKELQDLAANAKFDAVIAEYVFASKGLLAFPPSTRKLIDTHDLFHKQRSLFAAHGIRGMWRHINARNELRGLLRGDVIVSIQDEESQEFRRLLEDSRRVVTVGHMVEIDNVWSFSGEPLIGYLGTANDLNVMSINWLLDSIWPLVIARHPQAEFFIGGSICSRINPRPTVRLLGEIRNPGDLYKQVRLIVNPMRTGTGLKIKTVEALGRGMPTISTPAGAVGLTGRSPTGGLQVAENAEEFAKFIVESLPCQAQLAQRSSAAVLLAESLNRENWSAWESALGE